jgi:hypothetical protein
MTIVDSPTERPFVDDPQLLFREARQRRRRRWLTAGIAVAVFLLAIGLTVGLTGGQGGGKQSHPSTSALKPTGSVLSTASFSIRPILCYAPPYNPYTGEGALTPSLPACGPQYALTPENLQVTPDQGNANGYSSNEQMSLDPQFGPYQSTPYANMSNSASVLLPGGTAFGNDRYVLGPAAIDASAIKSAKAVVDDGQWSITLHLTDGGSAKFDALAHRQFHALIGVVSDGQVISAPITQPTQTSFTSFGGRVQISGGFTRQRAKQLAAHL